VRFCDIAGRISRMNETGFARILTDKPRSLKNPGAPVSRTAGLSGNFLRRCIREDR
jgi:hypothetical protein